MVTRSTNLLRFFGKRSVSELGWWFENNFEHHPILFFYIDPIWVGYKTKFIDFQLEAGKVSGLRFLLPPANAKMKISEWEPSNKSEPIYFPTTVEKIKENCLTLAKSAV